MGGFFPARAALSRATGPQSSAVWCVSAVFGNAPGRMLPGGAYGQQANYILLSGPRSPRETGFFGLLLHSYQPPS